MRWQGWFSWVGLLSRLSAILLLSAIGGCAALSASMVTFMQPSEVSESPAVNAYLYQRLLFGRVLALSSWRVGAGGADEADAAMGAPLPLGRAQLWLKARQADVPALTDRLDLPGSGCDGLRGQLSEAAARLAPLMSAWYGDRPLPVIDIELLLPSNASRGVRFSWGSPELLRIRVAKQLPTAFDCEWARFWVTTTLGTIVHELVHFDSHVNQRRGEDRLRDEYVAYLLDSCVLRELSGAQDRLVQRFPGMEHLSREALIELADRGRLPPTVAGRMLAYRDWPGVGAAPWAGGCPGLLAEYPDPRAFAAQTPMAP